MDVRPTVWFRIANGFMRLVFRGFARWRVEGAENVPTDGPLLVVSNHTHYLDPSLVNASVPRQVLYVAKRELVDEHPGWRRWCLLHYGLIPIDRQRLDRAALQQALDHIEAGGVIGMFPEGTRSLSGSLQRPRLGTAYLALSYPQMAILPVAVTGLAGLHLGPAVLWKRPRLTVRIGSPFFAPAASSANDRDALRTTGQQIMERIAALLPPEQRGPYANGEDA
ncbi:MAG: lysophospholipid acyltransferase family protein [Chloroflexi bacterium]|nr:lysophospholipid acyltransferase family protein [Chloroflexota bacterium]